MFDLRVLDNTAWLIEPNWLRRAITRLQAIPTCPTARDLVTERNRRMEVARNAAANAVRGVKGKIGLIEIYGPIEQRMSAAMEKLGGTSVEEISASLDVLLRDKSVDAIVYRIDSPGGSSYGIEELSDKIYNARQVKRSYAIADSMMASAAWWVGSAAGHVSITPGGDVGSQGVYAVHIDESKALEDEGVKIELVTAGKYKTEYSSHKPLSDEARENLQYQVDATYNKFINAVRRNRNASLDDVRNKYGQGRTLNAEQAKQAGMVDRIASFEDLLASLSVQKQGSGSAKSSAEVMRMRHEQRKRQWTLRTDVHETSQLA